MSLNTFNAKKTLAVGNREYDYYSLPEAEGLADISRLPVTLKILLENLLRFEDDVTRSRPPTSRRSAAWVGQPARGGGDRLSVPHACSCRTSRACPRWPTSPPCALRSCRRASTRRIINPLSPVDLVIDHSVMVDQFGTEAGVCRGERRARDGAQRASATASCAGVRHAFDNFSGRAARHRHLPPGEPRVPGARPCGRGSRTADTLAYPDTLVGTDSHTTMINGLGVLGWGVGGIEAEAAMLGQPISHAHSRRRRLQAQPAVGEGITATDLVLRVVEMLRAERRGRQVRRVLWRRPGSPARWRIGRRSPTWHRNTAPPAGFFPIDQETINYLRLSDRPARRSPWSKRMRRRRACGATPSRDHGYTDTLELDLGTVVPSLAGPKRPQDRVAMSDMAAAFDAALELQGTQDAGTRVAVPGTDYDLGHGDVVIAAITSCTNTSNPAVMLGAGLVAQKALARGLQRQAVGQDVARARLEGRHRIPRENRPAGCTGRTWLSTWSATAAPPVSATRARCPSTSRGHQARRSRGCVGAVGQPQLRRPRAPGGAHQLAGVAAAGGRLRPGGHDAHQPRARSDRSRRRRQRRVAARHLAVEPGGPATWSVRSRRTCSIATTRRLHRSASVAAIDVGRSGTYAWEDSTYIKQPPFFSVGGDQDQSVEVQGRAFWRCSATR